MDRGGNSLISCELESTSSQALDSVDSATDLSPKVTSMKCKTYSSSTLDVRSAMILNNDIA